ncbi:uncharacterized protein LOC124667531 isoform X1 [Lolium rigidum]|uniref:uncharacterized protein LOC124667531 isoform X1 n=1 Tax=Lolium rigidum TaxID=89674 RepID=UPI001F5C2493|nr:uncharacterized protein LOC124667531 isoform X1 [Lolium rigidum]
MGSGLAHDLVDPLISMRDNYLLFLPSFAFIPVPASIKPARSFLHHTSTSTTCLCRVLWWSLLMLHTSSTVPKLAFPDYTIYNVNSHNHTKVPYECAWYRPSARPYSFLAFFGSAASSWPPGCYCSPQFLFFHLCPLCLRPGLVLRLVLGLHYRRLGLLPGMLAQVLHKIWFRKWPEYHWIISTEYLHVQLLQELSLMFGRNGYSLASFNMSTELSVLEDYFAID